MGHELQCPHTDVAWVFTSREGEGRGERRAIEAQRARTDLPNRKEALCWLHETRYRISIKRQKERMRARQRGVRRSSVGRKSQRYEGSVVSDARGRGKSLESVVRGGRRAEATPGVDDGCDRVLESWRRSVAGATAVGVGGGRMRAIASGARGWMVVVKNRTAAQRSAV
jgi:hypothetical protein